MVKRIGTTFKKFDKETQNVIKVVARVMGIEQYQEIFNNFESKYTLPKYIVYAIYRRKGLSFPNIGKKLYRDHTSVMLGVKKLAEYPESELYIDESLRILNNEGVDKSYSKEVMDKVKSMLNEKYSDTDIVNRMPEVSEYSLRQVIKFIKLNCERKKVPDYKAYTVKEIFL